MREQMVDDKERNTEHYKSERPTTSNYVADSLLIYSKDTY